VPDSRLRAALAGAALTLALAAPAAAGFKEGIVAVQRERFETARQEFMTAHEAGDARGTFMLGVMREQGWGAPADEAEVAMWYRRAADAGLASAQFNLGIFHQFGRGMKQDEAQAAQWFAKAADQGHARAMNNLGSMYDTGSGVPQDRVEALKWFTLAADRLEGEDLVVVHDNLLRVEGQLSAAEIADAKARIAAWNAAHP